MAPPSSKPKLSDIDPDALALDVAQTMLDHVKRQAAAIAGRLAAPKAGLSTSPLFVAVQRLARYARGDAALDAPVLEWVISLLPLYRAPVDDRRGDVAEEAAGLGVDPETPLGLVICAAQARENVDRGALVSAAGLAALASISATQVRWLARSGELDLVDGEVAAKGARRWLHSRGVPGFGPNPGKAPDGKTGTRKKRAP